MGTTRRLTSGLLRSASEQGLKTWISDNEGIRGGGRLVARIYDRQVSFYFRYSIDSKLKYIPIGPYSLRPVDGRFTLEQARRAASDFAAVYRNPATRDLKQFQKPIPAGESTLQGAAIVTASLPIMDVTKSLGALCQFYVSELEREKKGCARQVEGEIRRSVLSSPLSERPAKDVTAKEITDLLREVTKRGKRAAGKARAFMNAAFERARTAALDADAPPGWIHFDVERNPVRETKARGKAGTRDRSLNERELGWLWHHLIGDAKAESVVYRALRLNLLLGGQRGAQLLRCRRSSYDEFKRTVVLYDGKGNRDKPRRHELPLTDLALKEVTELVLLSKAMESKLLIPTRDPERALNQIMLSKEVSLISRHFIAVELISEEAPFQYSDLRRTAETLMVDIGISKELRSQLLSHGLSGVQEIHYNRADYADQKLEALKMWESFIVRCAAEHRATYKSITSGNSK